MQKCYLLFLLLFTSELSFSQTTIFKGKVAWLDLITNFETSRYGINTEADLVKRIAKNGNLHLDSARLFLDAKKEQNLFLIFNEVSLNETKIITNGNTLTIFCNSLICKNSSIISFTHTNISAINDGKNNYNGKHGGIVRIVVLNQIHGKLNVFLDGQNGANGFNGIDKEEQNNSGEGYSYTQSTKNVDTYYDPSSPKYRRGTLDKRVYKSDPSIKKTIYATNGEDGGNGGDGGTLILFKTNATDELFKNQFHFTSFAGKIGLGGKGGKGINSNKEKTQNGNDGLEGKPGFIKIENYNFEDLFIYN